MGLRFTSLNGQERSITNAPLPKLLLNRKRQSGTSPQPSPSDRHATLTPSSPFENLLNDDIRNSVSY